MADTQAAQGLRIDRQANMPLHEQLVRQLRQRIAQGALKPGEKLPSLQTICRSCDVSMTTAQRALENLARAGLTVSRHGAGTFVAPRRAVRTTELILPGVSSSMDRWVDALVHQLRKGIEEGAGGDETRRVLTTFDHTDSMTAHEIVETARGRGADSVIVYCTPYHNLVGALAEAAACVPCVVIGAGVPGANLDSVAVRPDDGLRRMLEARLSRGAQHFAYVGGRRPPVSDSPYYAYGCLCSTLRSRLAEDDIAPEWIIYEQSRPWGEGGITGSEEEVLRLRERILALPEGTVVLTHTPSFAEYLVGLRSGLDVIAYTECRLTLEAFRDRVSFLYMSVEGLARAAMALAAERSSGQRGQARCAALCPEVHDLTGSTAGQGREGGGLGE